MIELQSDGVLLVRPFLAVTAGNTVVIRLFLAGL
jgi:hypothetical protein